MLSAFGRLELQPSTHGSDITTVTAYDTSFRERLLRCLRHLVLLGPARLQGICKYLQERLQGASDRVLGVPGRSAARRFARHVTALRSSRRDRAPRPKARLDIGLGRARAPARPNATLFHISDGETIAAFDLAILKTLAPAPDKALIWSSKGLILFANVRTFGYPYGFDLEVGTLGIRGLQGHIVGGSAGGFQTRPHPPTRTSDLLAYVTIRSLMGHRPAFLHPDQGP